MAVCVLSTKLELTEIVYRTKSGCDMGLNTGMGKDLLAGALGIEPRIAESESVVIPLHHAPVRRAEIWENFGEKKS